MKKVFAVLLAVMGLFVFCACERKENDETDKGKDEMPQLYDEIAQAYAARYNVDASGISYKSYGEFGGTYVLIVSCKGLDVATAENTVTVDGVEFHFNVMISFDVYRDGAFYTLQEAFDSGWLTHEDLLTVRRNHRAEYGFTYEEYDEPKKYDEIIQAYAALHNVNADDVGYKSYGEFDGTYVLIVYYGMHVDEVIGTETVDGVDFHFNEPISFDVYREGAFYTLQEAFDNGWLTHEDLLTVRRNHRAEYEFMYEEYDEPKNNDESEGV